jgi:hypothetical protein
MFMLNGKKPLSTDLPILRAPRSDITKSFFS